MGELNLIVSVVVAIFNLFIRAWHNRGFIIDYKKYETNTNNKIIKRYKPKLEDTFNKKDTSKIEEEMREILSDMGEEIRPLKLFDSINSFALWSASLLGISFITDILSSTPDGIKYDFNSISFLAFIVGIGLFFLMIINMIRLTIKVSNFKLGRNQK